MEPGACLARPFAERLEDTLSGEPHETQENQGTLPDRCIRRRDIRANSRPLYDPCRRDRYVARRPPVHAAAGVLPQNQARGEGTIEANRDSRNMQMAHP